MSFQDKLYPAPTNSFLKQEDLDKRPILDVRNLGIDFGGLTAVDSLDLMVGRTEITGLIGPNGAGKTCTRPPAAVFWWTAFPPPAKKPIR